MPDRDEVHTSPLPVAGEGGGWLLGGRYRVLERIGAGGMAEVFRAHDELLDRDVAVKVFRTLLDDPDSSVNAATRRELELQAMARLNHPHLVTLYDGSVAGDGPPYLVLEYVPGRDLASRLREGPLPEPAVRELGAQLADGLAFVHAHGLVHRDVKPANILLDEDAGHGRARLSDFGVVRMIGSPQMTSAELTIGTAYYLAPEQARGSGVGPEADVYALGLVLLEALTGRRAFDGPMHEALAARLATNPTIPDGLPEPWPGLLAAMTAREPANRPDAATVATQLRSGVHTGPLAAAAASVPPVLAPADAVTAAVLAAAPAAAVSGVAPAAPAARRRRHLHPAWLLGAAVIAAATAIGAYLLPAASNGTGGGTAPPTTLTTPPTSSTTTHHRRSSVPAANVVVQPSTKPKRHLSRHRTATRPASSTPAAAQPTTSAPPSSSSAPASSSAPPTSPTPSPSSDGTTAAAAAAAPSLSPSPTTP